jgi:DNA polymerase III subunit gamma/tau
MSYQVTARKWRPQTFAELAGQEHVARTLQNALRQGRIAHAYLFTGTRGVGKTTTARLLAKTLDCELGPLPEPCNQCPSCQAITLGSSLDVLEIDGASNRGIDEIRDLREKIRYAPTRSRYKIYIIDEVHMLTEHAFNALLKTLEEPPPQVVFIFATTEPQKVPSTILSRCQRFDFRKVASTEIALCLG